MRIHIFNMVLSLIKYALKFEMSCGPYFTTHQNLKNSLVLGRVGHAFSWQHREGMWPNLGQSEHYHFKTCWVDSEVVRQPSSCRSASSKELSPRLPKAALFLLFPQLSKSSSIILMANTHHRDRASYKWRQPRRNESQEKRKEQWEREKGETGEKRWGERRREETGREEWKKWRRRQKENYH